MRMNQNQLVLLTVLAVLVLGGGFWFMQSRNDAMMKTNPAVTTDTNEVVEDVSDVTEDTADTDTMKANNLKNVTLAKVAGSAVTQTGNASFEEKDGKVIVRITVSPALEGSQPAHIHTGACPTPGDVVYPLTDVVDGTSVTTLNATMEELTAKMPLAINVHKSTQEVKVYTACGDIK